MGAQREENFVKVLIFWAYLITGFILGCEMGFIWWTRIIAHL